MGLSGRAVRAIVAGTLGMIGLGAALQLARVYVQMADYAKLYDSGYLLEHSSSWVRECAKPFYTGK